MSCVSTSGQLCDDTQGLTCSGLGTTCACPAGYFFNGTACRKQLSFFLISENYKLLPFFFKLTFLEQVQNVGLGCDFNNATNDYFKGCGPNMECNTFVTPNRCV